MTRQRRTTVFHRLWMPVLTSAFLGYFAIHAFGGSYGLRAMERLADARDTLTLRLGYLRAQRQSLEQRVAAVRPESLDTETVDYRARLALNMLRSDEIVVRFGAPQ